MEDEGFALFGLRRVEMCCGMDLRESVASRIRKEAVWRLFGWKEDLYYFIESEVIVSGIE